MSYSRSIQPPYDPRTDPAPDVYTVRWHDEARTRATVTHYAHRLMRAACCTAEVEVLPEDYGHELPADVMALARSQRAMDARHEP